MLRDYLVVCVFPNILLCRQLLYNIINLLYQSLCFSGQPNTLTHGFTNKVGGQGGRGSGGVWEAGEERAGSRSSKRVGSGRDMRNANFFKFNNVLDYFQKQETKIYFTCI